ncbi:hypothetical protein D3C80_1151520 [compost metagenome]
MVEGLGRQALRIAEHITPTAYLDQALVNVHGAAGRVRQRLGHAHHGQAVLERHFLEQVLEQEGLVGQQQRVAVQQVDLELADTHFVHEGVTWQAERGHALVHLLEERAQAVVGADTECRMAKLATAIAAYGWLERLLRVAVGGKNKEFEFGRHHGRQPQGRVAGDDRLELATGGQCRGPAIQFNGIADGQGATVVAPGQAMDLAGFGHQRQVAVVAAVEFRRRVAAHDALQQHPPGHLQAAAFQKAFGGHHLAARDAVEVGGDAFDFIDALELSGAHDACPCCCRLTTT